MSKKQNLLTILIFVALVAGIVVGEFLLYNASPADPTEHAQTLALWKSLGDIILIRPLLMIVVPLIFISVIVGISSLGDPARLGLVGGATVVYYLSTMFIAVVIGIVLVTNMKPGVGVDESFREEQISLRGEEATQKVTGAETELGSAWMNLVKQIIPDNPLRAAVDGQVLSVITFAILIGLALSAIGPRGEPALQLFEALFQALMTMIHWILWLTPPGVFFLTAWSVGSLGLGNIAGPIGWYMLTVVVGLLIHAFIVLPAILSIFGKTNPYKYFWKMRRALMTAFGTDSSSATLPVTMEVAEEEAGCSRKAANFVLPLGSTVNMDGTALYEAVAVVFLFQVFEIPLAFPELLIVVITATLAAVGAAGIPSAGLVTMVIVIMSVNTALNDPEKALPLAAIGIILGVDRILDMCRTTVNVWGDAVGARIMTRLAPDEPPSRSAKSPATTKPVT
jgi:Na+/H+-dicarboxylate symporter